MAIVKLTPWALPRFSPFVDDSLFDEWDESTAVDMYEEPDHVVVKVQLPGFNEDDIKVTIEGSTLTIRADMHEETEDKKKKYYKKEIRTQSIVRSITLPTPVSADKTLAELKNGMLMLTLPKAEEAKPKEISIKKITKAA